MDTFLVVDVEAMEVDAPQSTLVVEPTGIPNYFTSIAPVPATASRPPLTQAMIYKMGNFAYSVDMRVVRVEADVSSMTDHAIAGA